MKSAIDGVVITPLRQIFDERGKVMHMLRADDPHFQQFGEVYFSTVHSSVVKAWHRHKEMGLNYAVIYGQIKFVLHDDRPDSPSCGVTEEYFLSPENYMLVSVPPRIWNGFKGVANQTSIVANCATLPHSSDEIERRDPNDRQIGYEWNINHR